MNFEKNIGLEKDYKEQIDKALEELPVLTKRINYLERQRRLYSNEGITAKDYLDMEFSCMSEGLLKSACKDAEFALFILEQYRYYNEQIIEAKVPAGEYIALAELMGYSN